MEHDGTRLEQAHSHAAPADEAGKHARFPSLAPAESEQQPEVAETGAPTRVFSGHRFNGRPESEDFCAFLTVYALNASVMLFAFPVGMLLLVYNILAGENLRTSAHVMGLTGLMTALPLIGTPVPFIA